MYSQWKPFREASMWTLGLALFMERAVTSSTCMNGNASRFFFCGE
jgi:hypothetical protein